MAKNNSKKENEVKIHDQKINRLEIKNLKGIKDLDIVFDKPLTALVGSNCVGKTTILDALASIYKNSNQFSKFFIPNKYNDWSESEFKVYFEHKENGEQKSRKVTYKKSVDRWTPVNSRRPLRNVLYLRISDEIPEYEKYWDQDIRFHEIEENSIPKEESIIAKSKAILAQSYNKINEVKVQEETKVLSVKNNDIKYLSLDMGAGEQKIIKYLMLLESMERFSLVLIDELDVFIHSRSFRELVKVLNQIAINKKLQIIFTTHNDTIVKCEDYVDVKYLMKTSDRTLIVEKPTPDVMYSLNGDRKKDFEIYVEDSFSECIIQEIIAEMGMRKQCEILCFGAASNAFTISSGLRLKDYKNYYKTRFVLDGDVYSKETEKRKKICELLTGDTNIAKKQREGVEKSILQYSLPQGKKPEEFVADMLLGITDVDKDILEIQEVVRENYSVMDKHEIIEKSLEELNYDKKMGYSKIISLIKNEDSYQEYIVDVKRALDDMFNEFK